MANREDELGCLWQKSSSKGDYFSGQLEIDGTKHEIVVFPNGYKEATNQPDWIVYKSKPRAPRA